MKRVVLLAALLVACAHPAPGSTTTSAATPKLSGPAAMEADEQPAGDDATRLIPLEGARNVRELGGLRGSRPIPKDRVVRTADLSHATAADRERLIAHGVKLDIDLRTPGEIERQPDPLARDPRVTYVNLSLMGPGPLDVSKVPSLGELYVRTLAERQDELRQVFHLLATAGEDGAVLYHCSAGKDRTGMVTAILLALAGVDRAAIVHEYAISSHYLGDHMADFTAKHPELAHVAGSPRAAIERFLDTLDGTYGGARAYLRTIGVTDADVAVLARRLGQSG